MQIVVQKLLLFTEHEKRKRVPKFLETAEVFKNKAVVFVSDKGEKISFQPYTVENGGKTTVPVKGLGIECIETECITIPPPAAF